MLSPNSDNYSCVAQSRPIVVIVKQFRLEKEASMTPAVGIRRCADGRGIAFKAVRALGDVSISIFF